MPINSRNDYCHALNRLSMLLNEGLTAENCWEVAVLEGEVAEYVMQHGKPDMSLGRPGGRN